MIPMHKRMHGHHFLLFCLAVACSVACLGVCMQDCIAVALKTIGGGHGITPGRPAIAICSAGCGGFSVWFDRRRLCGCRDARSCVAFLQQHIHVATVLEAGIEVAVVVHLRSQVQQRRIDARLQLYAVGLLLRPAVRPDDMAMGVCEKTREKVATSSDGHCRFRWRSGVRLGLVRMVETAGPQPDTARRPVSAAEHMRALALACTLAVGTEARDISNTPDACMG